jgi:hypothetical protein
MYPQSKRVQNAEKEFQQRNEVEIPEDDDQLLQDDKGDIEMS